MMKVTCCTSWLYDQVTLCRQPEAGLHEPSHESGAGSASLLGSFPVAGPRLDIVVGTVCGSGEVVTGQLLKQYLLAEDALW